jgi:hypothetical protein
MADSDRSSHDTASTCCPECGAEVDPAWMVCWMCEALLRAPANLPPARKPRRRVVPKRDSSSSIAVNTSLIGAVAVVWLGVTLARPGLGFLLAIGALPATVRTLIVVHQRQAAGKATAPVDAGLMFFGSLLVTSLLLVATFFVAAGVLVFGLFATCASGWMPSQEDSIAVGVVLCLIAFCCVAWGFWKVIRARFHEDISRL